MTRIAVDDHEVWMCTELKNGKSWFLPFNKGYNDGAGNPPNPTGLATDYLWKETLQPLSLTNIIENYAQISGEHDVGGKPMDEAAMNGFPSSQIEELIQEDPYRFLIVADKFQTGYDEPLLHTMYVDKILSAGKAAQTLSRLNRAHPLKHDTFVLDFVNDADTIQKAFEPYYRTTILSEATDPNKIHDLKSALDARQVYAWPDVETLVQLYLGGAERDKLDPILDACVAVYTTQLDEDAQVEFKGSAKTFVRTYSFLATVLPYTFADWEKLSIFLNFLIPKLPAPKEDDHSKGILETIDMDTCAATQCPWSESEPCSSERDTAPCKSTIPLLGRVTAFLPTTG